MNVILDAVTALFKGKTFTEGLQSALIWVFRQSPFILRAGALVSLIVAVVTGTIVWLNLSDLNSSVIRALVDPSHSEDVPNSVLESFFLSTAMSDRNIESDLSHSELNADFVEKLNDLQKDMHGNLSKKTSVKKLHLDVMASSTNERPGDNGATFFLSDEEPGFLFVPGVITVTRESLSKLAGKSVDVAETQEPLLFRDVILSQAAADSLCHGLGEINRTQSGIFSDGKSVPYLSKRFTQSYVIFRSGVTRICNDDLGSYDYKNQRRWYMPQFTPDTLLQDKQYFVKTMEDTQIRSHHDGRVPPKEFLHPTQLYIDRGGNGIVETFCRPLVFTAGATKFAAQPTDAILCLDFRIASSVSDLIQARIMRFGGTAVPVRCDEANGCVRDESHIGQTAPMPTRIMSWLFPTPNITDADLTDISETYRSTSTGDRQKITGRVKVRPSNAAGGDTALSFTIPLGESRLLAGKLDLVAYQRWSSIYDGIFASTVVVTVVFIMMMFASYGATLKEQERAFHAVDIVMGDVPAPYARVGEDGRFTRVNDAFAKELGYKTANEALAYLKDRSYEDYLADDDSKETYKAVKQERQEGAKYRSYRVNLWCGRLPGEDPIKGFEVHGWNVPGPGTSKKHPGPSFGILLPLRRRAEEAVSGKLILFTELRAHPQMSGDSDEDLTP
jgi:hypothetical protein